MANGYCPGLLYSIDVINRQNSPSTKLHNAGFIAMLNCCANSSVEVNSGSTDGGHLRPITVSYRERPLVSEVQTEDNCDINVIPVKKEWTLPGYSYASHSQYISDNTMRQFCEEASRKRTIGAPATQVMQEVYDLFLQSANVVMKKMNQDLVTDAALAFGINTTTGSNTGKVINIARDQTGLVLDNGMVEVLRDMQENDICGTPCMVGGGIWSSFQLAQLMACCSAAGIDMSRLNMPQIWYDRDTQATWGENSLGVFAPGSVALLEHLEFKGSFVNQPGASLFFTAPLPVDMFNCADACQAVDFDVQLKYYDCPTLVEGPEGPVTIPRGWMVKVSKYYALWYQPTNAYKAGDELEGTNGILRYFATNNADGGGAYPYAF